MSKKLNLIQRRKIRSLQVLKRQRRINNSLPMRNNYRRIVDRKKRSLTQRNQTTLVRMINLMKRNQILSIQTKENWKVQSPRMRRVFQRHMRRNINLSPILKTRDLLMRINWRLISKLIRLVSSILIKIKWWLTRTQMMKKA